MCEKVLQYLNANTDNTDSVLTGIHPVIKCQMQANHKKNEINYNKIKK